jgi:branched-chain amino acid aminotransferase
MDLEKMEQDARAAKDSRSYTDGAAFVDGRFLPVGEARVPILDWGFLRSDATYDVAHVWRGCFFRLEDYLDRFERSMEHLRLSRRTTGVRSGTSSSSACA